MKALNRAQIVGRIGKDLNLSYTSGQNQKAVLNFSVATTDTWKDQQTGEQKEATEWHNVVVFGPSAEFVQRTFRKGSRVSVEGRLKTRKWQDSNGHDRYTTEIVVDRHEHRVDPAEWPSDQTAAGYQQPQQPAQPQRPHGRQQPSQQPQQTAHHQQPQQDWNQDQPFGG